MIQRLTERCRTDDGITLVELMIASLASLIIGAVMVTWLISVSQTDTYEQQASIALEQMRVAKGRLVKDLRFADSVNTPAEAHEIELSLEGDIVTWRFESDGRLTRTVAGTPTEHAHSLVYDAAAGPGSSRFVYDNVAAPTQVTIELVADIESTQGPEPKQIRTDVHLRNI